MVKRNDLPAHLREFDRNSLSYDQRLGWKTYSEKKVDDAKAAAEKKFKPKVT